MGLLPGTRLGHYAILEPLGAGGMGEVYRAHDSRLDRDVALKVLPEGALGNEEARHRFRKEAHALSRLSHPHIATLLDFDAQDGVDYLAMELVPGRSLRDELQTRRTLPEKTVVRLGVQIAHGLQAAHEQGVIHRDLKPSNLHLTPDGLLKILDFGLARLLQPKPTAPGDSTATETAAGTLLGSPPYMAPEQLLGGAPDARSDVYSAGAVLCELATGQRPFGSRSGAALTDAILHQPPPRPRSLLSSVSPGLEAVILKALDKDPELRYQTVKDLLVDLERLQERPESASLGSGPVADDVALPGRRRRRARRSLVAATALALMVAVGVWVLRPFPPPRVINIRALTDGLDEVPITTVSSPSWATDGIRVYFVAARRGQPAVFQVPVAGGEAVARPLPFNYRNAIRGYLPAESALLMTGSETSYAGWDYDIPLWTVPVPAGAPARVGNLSGWRAAVSADGRTLAAGNARLRTILVARRDGSIEQELDSLPTYGPHSVAWAPDGHRIRYTADGPDGPEPWIWEVATDGEKPRPLWPGANGRWSGNGRYFLFERQSPNEGWRSDLYAVREGARWPRAESPVRLTAGPMSFTLPGTSPDGARLFAFGRTARAEVLQWSAAERRFVPYLGGVSASVVDASQDGAWVAWVSYPDGALWRSRPDGTDRLKLTAAGWNADLPRWSPDARSIVFGSTTPDQRQPGLYLVSRDGSSPELLVRSETGTEPWDPCWAPDGKTVYFSYVPRAFAGIRQVDLATGDVAVVPGGERLHFPKCSSRGDLLAVERVPAGSAGGVVGLWIFRADRDSWARVAAANKIGGLPTNKIGGFANWSTDGESVISLDFRTGRLLRWTPSTGDIEAIADVGGIRLLNMYSVPWAGLAHDGSPLVIRDLSTRDLYALEWEAP